MKVYAISHREGSLFEWERLDTGERLFHTAQDPQHVMDGKDFAHVLHENGRWEPDGLFPQKRKLSSWPWPIKHPPGWPPEAGQFAAVRKFDVHTGVDLYCPEGTEVIACEECEVINIEDFTGPDAGSPWWHDTKAVLVKGSSGIICYGEVAPLVRVGDRVQAQDVVGTVKRVLKRDKGLPTSMLHIELYEPEGFTETVVWPLGKKKPAGLLDPSPRLWGAS